MPTSVESSGDSRFDGAAFAKLVQGAKAASSAEQAWPYLEAAHVVGQLHLKSHLQTHAEMCNLGVIVLFVQIGAFSARTLSGRGLQPC